MRTLFAELPDDYYFKMNLLKLHYRCSLKKLVMKAIDDMAAEATIPVADLSFVGTTRGNIQNVEQTAMRDAVARPSQKT